MQFNEIYEKTVYAFEHDEVFELIKGEDGYSYQMSYVPVQLPTFIDEVFRVGIYRLYNESPKEIQRKIIEKIINAINKLKNSNDPVERWWAFSVLFSIKLDESKTQKSPFYIADELLKDLGPLLHEVKSELFGNKAYGGCGMAEGVWGDVLRINRLLMCDCNINILEV